MWYEITEQNIMDSASDMKDQTNNVFFQMLEMGEEYKKLGLTPIYIYNPKTKEIITTCKERLDNSLN
jgi:hypothetical protein